MSKSVHRAACLAALYTLAQAGKLEGLQAHQLAATMGVDRTTIWRYMQDLPEVERLVVELLDLYQQQHPTT
jgi:hypothetical protein